MIKFQTILTGYTSNYKTHQLEINQQFRQLSHSENSLITAIKKIRSNFLAN